MAKKEVNKGGYRITLDCISINIKDEENEGNLSFIEKEGFREDPSSAGKSCPALHRSH